MRADQDWGRLGILPFASTEDVPEFVDAHFESQRT